MTPGNPMFGQFTAGGYPFGEVVSALQKEIRRGNATLACYWATEIEQVGGRETTYLWNRLKIIGEEVVAALQRTGGTRRCSALHDAYAAARNGRDNGPALEPAQLAELMTGEVMSGGAPAPEPWA